MNEDEYKSILKFVTWEENRLGNVFSGQSSTTVKSVAKDIAYGMLRGYTTVARTYDNKILQKIKEYYYDKLIKNEIRVISHEKMIQFLNKYQLMLDEREKSFWTSGSVGHIRVFQRAQQYSVAVRLIEFKQKMDEETKQKSIKVKKKAPAKKKVSATKKASATKQLLELKKLLDADIITQEEYEKKASPLKKIILL